MNHPRYRDAFHPATRDKPVFILNTGMTRLREGEVTKLHPDGRREPWSRQPQAGKASA
jgi:hypothetical protein